MTDLSKKLKPKFCGFCHETFTPKRAWQSFCKEKCRVQHFAKLQMEQIERDARRRIELEIENEALHKEIVTLKQQLESLK